jgi:hypothetical protein
MIALDERGIEVSMLLHNCGQPGRIGEVISADAIFNGESHLSILSLGPVKFQLH